MRAKPIFSFEQAMTAWISLYSEIAGKAQVPGTVEKAVAHEPA
ncbi:hypothetical protein HRbin22_02010 [Candidatus Thermoflexus japonica]|uniref:Uncharacterized protein n=1 Tax=Candidatus Thermoflexus japonica TaxID=2035417 RepID=A0A2H5Y8I7_9CHLR|nr:hypothetical protein HRbin22_02010 [Candidatus Thermoflexus japonica]